jgi:hypothetical protein
VTQELPQARIEATLHGIVDVTEEGGSSRPIAPPRKWALLHAYLWIAEHRALACVLSAFFVLVVRAALLPWLLVPNPAMHDEFSLLLGADTFAHGRLANPPHAMWQHFETFHVLMSPTYASKYPVLPGMVMALCQKLFGLPWVGIYLSMGLLAAALCWMLQSWISPGWALFGALTFAMKVGVTSYWMDSYMAAPIPGIGGALMLGATGLIWRFRKYRHAGTWAVGLAILVHSRPYDAAVLALVTGVMLLWTLLREQPSRMNAFGIMLRWSAPVLAVAAAALLLVNYRVTGNARTLPYQAHDRQYAVAPLFAFMPLRATPVYRHEAMREFWAEWNVNQWKGARAQHLGVPRKMLRFADFFLGFPVLMLGALLFPFPQLSREERASAALGAAFLLMIAPLIEVMPHYGAAFAGVIYLRFVQFLRRLTMWRPAARPVGTSIAILFGCLIPFWFISSTLMLTGQRGFMGKPRDRFSKMHADVQVLFGDVRASVKERIVRMPGNHLVIVNYSPKHVVHFEWVFNDADIDASRVVWARQMGGDDDRALVRYFADRKVWLLEADEWPPRLRPYEDGQ